MSSDDERERGEREGGARREGQVQTSVCAEDTYISGHNKAAL